MNSDKWGIAAQGSTLCAIRCVFVRAAQIITGGYPCCKMIQKTRPARGLRTNCAALYGWPVLGQADFHMFWADAS